MRIGLINFLKKCDTLIDFYKSRNILKKNLGRLFQLLGRMKINNFHENRKNHSTLKKKEKVGR